MAGTQRPARILELRSVRGTGGGPEKTILMGTAQASRGRFDITVCYIRDAARSGLRHRRVGAAGRCRLRGGARTALVRPRHRPPSACARPRARHRHRPRARLQDRFVALLAGAGRARHARWRRPTAGPGTRGGSDGSTTPPTAAARPLPARDRGIGRDPRRPDRRRCRSWAGNHHPERHRPGTLRPRPCARARGTSRPGPVRGGPGDWSGGPGSSRRSASTC